MQITDRTDESQAPSPQEHTGGTMPQEVTTAEFTVRPQVHARRGMTRVMLRCLWPLAVPVAALLAMSAHDWRWSVVALALLLVVAPVAAMFVWITLAGRQDAVDDLLPHRLHATHKGAITLQWAAREEHRVPPTLTLPPGTVRRVEADKMNLYLILSPQKDHGSRREIIIPRATFADDTQLRRLASILAAAGAEMPL